MIVTIDGPAGAGKSSAARALAERLGFRFLDTGAMYRAVAYAAILRRLDWNDPAALANLAEQLQIEMEDDRVLLDGADVSAEIRTVAVTEATKYAADNPAVRAHLVKLQQAFGRGRNIVTEGRDQGTVVFPAAECKIYLTATPAERARRRLQELQSQGQAADFESVLASQTERDARDATREVGAMYQAADAIELLTDGLNPTEVVDRMEALVRSRAV
jgi:cytidylate kinase